MSDEPRTARSNGISHVHLEDIPEALTELRADVRDLRAEVRAGFAAVDTAVEALRRNDARQDLTIGQLARKYTPYGVVVLVAQVIVEIIKHLPGH